MNQMLTLMRRELWEHRSTFVVLPLVIAAFLSAVLLLLVFMVHFGDGDFFVIVDSHGSEQRVHTEKVSQFAQMSESSRADILSKTYYSVSVPFLITLWFVVLFYLLSALYEERKDRSVLFWKSMPVSDLATVGSKLICAAVVAPLIYLAFIWLVDVVLLLTASLAMLGSGVSVFEALWGPSNLLLHWFSLLAVAMLQTLWCLPFFGWILLVSATVRSAPLLWVIGIPIGIRVLEGILFEKAVLSGWMSRHALPFFYGYRLENGPAEVFAQRFNVDLLIAVIAGLVMLAGAVFMRKRSSDI